jgi:hypothetical protein
MEHGSHRLRAHTNLNKKATLQPVEEVNEESPADPGYFAKSDHAILPKRYRLTSDFRRWGFKPGDLKTVQSHERPALIAVDYGLLGVHGKFQAIVSGLIYLPVVLFEGLTLTVSKIRILQTGLICALTVYVLSGCGAVYRHASAWEGHTIDQLINSWGEPKTQVDLGQGLRAYSWLSENDNCEQTFTVQNEKIISVADKGCSS